MTSARTKLLTLALALLFSLAADAQVPGSNPEWERYVTALQPYGHSSAVGTTQSVLLTTASGSYTDERDAWLIPWDSLLVMQCPLETCVCATMEDEIAVVTMGSGTTCGQMTDSGTPPDGQGVCWRVQTRRDIKVSRTWFGRAIAASTSKPGYRSGYCSNTTGTTGYPCDANDDCVTGAGAAGTCVANTPDQIRGFFLMHEAAVATNCSFEIEG